MAQCRALVDGAVPAYVPVVRGGGKMHVRMLCLGRHWNGKTYSYEPTRTNWLAVRKAPSEQFLFGTDDLGRDVLSRLVYGARASLLAGVIYLRWRWKK